MKTSDGRLIVVGGASRSGKSAYVVKRVRPERRVIAWDPEDQWAQLPGFRRVTSRMDLLAACQTTGHARIAFVAGGDLVGAFNFWAGVVMFWGRYRGPCVAIAEEVADVTTTAKAPGNWGILLRRGLKRGITIFAISQRWSEADKTAMGNASEFVLFRMASADDVRYLTKKTRVPADALEGLRPLEWVGYDGATFELTRGKLRF